MSRSMFVYMYVVCGNVAKLITVSTDIDVFPWDFDAFILDKSYTCDLNRSVVKGHIGVTDLRLKLLKKGHWIHLLWCIYGSWAQ